MSFVVGVILMGSIIVIMVYLEQYIHQRIKNKSRKEEKDISKRI